MMSSNPTHKGQRLELGGRTYIVPAMNAGTIEDFEDRIAALEQGREPRPAMLVVDLLHRCLRRNYPDIDRDFVRDHVDLDNWCEIFAMVMGQSGYRQWAELEAAQGNERALQILATLKGGAGAPSTPTSPPVSDGPSSTAAST